MDTQKTLHVETTPDGFVIKKGRKRQALSYEQLFAIAHSLFIDGYPKAAEDAFRELAKTKGRGARAKFMLARCKAELEKYDDCEQIVNSIFGDDEAPVADELQTAFVYHSIGMTLDAIKEMIKVVNQHPNLPTACLYLGDLFEEAGQSAKAVQCWALAIKRDRKDGTVGNVAKKQIERVRVKAKKINAKRSENKEGQVTSSKRKSVRKRTSKSKTSKRKGS